MAKDYYNILGVNKTASRDEIKKAFYKLAHKYHPDKKGGNESKFKEVNEAYQVLSDDAKRSQYDQFGTAYQNMGGFSGGNGPASGWDFNNFGGFESTFGGDFGNLNDIFTDFFGGGMGRPEARRGRDISTEIQISFPDAIFGTERKILLTKASPCDVCRGDGAEPGTKTETCKRCNGQGKLRETKRSFLGSISTTKICEACDGEGVVPKDVCERCKGKGVLRREEEISVVVPPGIRDGEMIRMTGRGEAVFKGTSGDLYIKINVAAHPVFKRDGQDLIMALNLKLSDALLGTKHSIKTLDGEIEVTIQEGVSVNETLRVRGKGVPIGKGKRGDLLIKLNIKLPNKLSRKSRELVEKLQEEGI